MKAEEIIKDKGDIVVVMENTVSSKIEEILSLKEQLEALRKVQFPFLFVT